MTSRIDLCSDCVGLTRVFRGEHQHLINGQWRGGAEATIYCLRHQLLIAKEERDEARDRLKHPASVSNYRYMKAVAARKKWEARAKHAENELEAAQAACAAYGEALRDYFGWAGAKHEPGCPEDDTCKCAHLAKLNAIDPRANPGQPILDRLAKAEAENERLASNMWAWSRGLVGQKPYTPDELREMYGPYVEDGDTTGLSPREARLLETLITTGADVHRLEEAARHAAEADKRR